MEKLNQIYTCGNSVSYNNKILHGDALTVLKSLPDSICNCCVTSPPYFNLRDYGMCEQLGAESSPAEYVQRLVEILREVRRVLRGDGTLWLNLGDSYAGSNQGHGTKNLSKKQVSNVGSIALTEHQSKSRLAKINGYKPKDLIGIPWQVAFALRDDGWYLRQDIIWHKPNPMPESVKDRCTKSHEYIFLLSKSKKYYFDARAIAEPVADSTLKKSAAPEYDGKLRNKRDVWSVTTTGFKGAHFATFPKKLVAPCILAGCPAGGLVLDPFFGSGTTGVVAKQNRRNYLGIDINADYCQLAQKRVDGE